MKARIFVYSFIAYYVFAIIGSNLYLGLTALSFGNISIILLFFAFLLTRGSLNLTHDQKMYLIPLVLFIFLITIYLFAFIAEVQPDYVAHFFYLTLIPVLYIMIMSLGNNYGEYFFRKTYFILKFILLLLVFVVILELFFKIHMPVYDYEKNAFNLPTAFFGNSNDLGAITMAMFPLFVAFNQRYGKRNEFYIYTALVFFLITITLSRLAFITLILFFPFYFIIVRKKSIRFVIIFILIVAVLGYIFSTIVINYIPNKQIDNFGWVNNRLLSIKDKNAYDVEGSSSMGIRYSIYSYPFKNPEKFITGYGFGGDNHILKKEIRWSGITNAHSFFIEIVYDFGWFGLLLMLWFFIAFIQFAIVKGKKMKYRYSLLYLGSFIVIINISSSIFGKPVIWIPLFIYLAYITSNRPGIAQEDLVKSTD